MANQNANATISEQVRMHGELLAKIVVIQEEDHEDLKDLKKAVGVIAQAEANRSTREELKASLKARAREFLVPFVTTILGLLAGHFIR